MAAAPRSRPGVPGGVPPQCPHSSAVPVPLLFPLELPPLLRVAALQAPGALRAEPPDREGAEPEASVCFLFAFIFRTLEVLRGGRGPLLSVREQSPSAGQFQQPRSSSATRQGGSAGGFLEAPVLSMEGLWLIQSSILGCRLESENGTLGLLHHSESSRVSQMGALQEGSAAMCHEQSGTHSSCSSDGASPEHEWRSITVIMGSLSSQGPLGMAMQLKLMLQLSLVSIVLHFRRLQVSDG